MRFMLASHRPSSKQDFRLDLVQGQNYARSLPPFPPPFSPVIATTLPLLCSASINLTLVAGEQRATTRGRYLVPSS